MCLDFGHLWSWGFEYLISLLTFIILSMHLEVFLCLCASLISISILSTDTKSSKTESSQLCFSKNDEK